MIDFSLDITVNFIFLVEIRVRLHPSYFNDLKSSIEKETKKLNEIKKFSLISQKEAESELELINTECINKRSSAENDLSSLKNSIIESQQIIANLNEVITESKSTIANLFEQKETLESTLENLKLQINTNKNTNLSLTNELNNLNILVDVFKKEVETLQLREKDLQSSIEEKESTLGADDLLLIHSVFINSNFDSASF